MAWFFRILSRPKNFAFFWQLSKGFSLIKKVSKQDKTMEQETICIKMPEKFMIELPMQNKIVSIVRFNAIVCWSDCK